MPRAAFLTLTARDSEILEVLTRRVTALSVVQIARTWWRETAHAEASARNRLRTLAREDLIAHVSLIAHPECLMQAPLARWDPGTIAPDLAHVAYQLQCRWEASSVTTPAVIATAAAGRRFGGRGGRIPRRTDATHDLHLAALYLKFRVEQPGRAASWTCDRFIDAARENHALPLPDALVLEGDSPLVIEMGGSSYRRPKLEALHRYCEAEGLPYEIW